MIPALTAHLWQSTLFAGVAALLTLALRKNSAQVRYRIWFIASIKLLVPFSLLVGVGALVPQRVTIVPFQPRWVDTAEQIGEPLLTLPAVTDRIASEGAGRDYLAAAAAIVWACGFAAIATVWLLRWRRVDLLRKSAVAARIEFPVPVMSAHGSVEPGIVGILRPVLLLPHGIENRLDRAQLDAILAHELCHVRRRDNLTATIHMFVQAIFWFHPLIWWLGARLVDERERACDEEVLRLGSRPQIYATGILNVCRLYVEAPLACVSGVTGANLKRRIEAIMKNGVALRLNLVKMAALAVAGTAAIAIPIAIGVGIIQTPLVHAQAPTARATKWEAVSIKRCNNGQPAGEQGPSPLNTSTNRIRLSCYPLRQLIQNAYGLFAGGHWNGAYNRLNSIEKLPDWSKSETYTIEAKAEGSPGQMVMLGPMLQTILQNRFALKIHTEARDEPAYALTTAKGGIKVPPFKGGCTPENPLSPDPTPTKDTCPRTQQDWPMNLDTFAWWLGREIRLINAAVINKTGITGYYRFNWQPIHALYPPTGPPDYGESVASLATTLQGLGLKLEATKAPREHLVVDHVERPSEN